jgi:hypothetical protein
MRPKPLPLPATQILVNTRTLAERWGVDPRTAIRICRFHELAEITMVPGGRILYARGDVEDLETQLFGVN